MSLLESIQSEIKAAGGRMTLAHQIIEESPGWFSIEDRRFLKRRAYLAEASKRRTMNRQKSKRQWKEEDIEFLLDKYGKIPISRIARILDRTKGAIQAKFYKTASKEVIDSLPDYVNGRGYK